MMSDDDDEAASTPYTLTIMLTSKVTIVMTSERGLAILIHKVERTLLKLRKKYQTRSGLN